MNDEKDAGKMSEASDARNPESPDADVLTVTATQADLRFGELLSRALSNRRTVITRHGFRTAAIVPIADFDRLERKAG